MQPPGKTELGILLSMIRMEVTKIPKLRRITKTERILIAQWKVAGLSNKVIAKRLGRCVSSIGREIKRNSFNGEFYEPLHAQSNAEANKRRAWKAKEPLKTPKIYSYVMDRLKRGWSPEQIAGRLRYEYPKDRSWWICPETIYAFVYKPDNKYKRLWEYLRRKQVRRKLKSGRKSLRVRIPDRVSIHQRPKEVEKRIEPGHWEGDSVVGKGHSSGLHTEYERVISLTKIEKVERINSDETIRAQIKIFEPLPKALRRSDTMDNGSEMVNHRRLKDQLGMDTYFADPYSAYQRGGNENANLWIRYYFPKGTDFSKVNEEEIQDIEWELNNRPRKRLGFKTPVEKLQEYL